MRQASLATELGMAAILIGFLLCGNATPAKNRGNPGLFLVSADQAVPSTMPATLPDGTPLPSPTSTGPSSGVALTAFDAANGLRVSTPGQLVQNLAITGWVEITAPNVTITNCTLNGPTTLSGGGMLTIDAGASNCTIQNMRFTGGPTNSSAIQSNGAGAQILNCAFVNLPVQGVYSSQSVTIHGCYFHDVGWDAAGIKSNPLEPLFNGLAHTEDIYIAGGSYSVITSNNLDTPIASIENGVNYAQSTAEIFYDPQGGAIEGPAMISNNVIAGDGIFTGTPPGPIFYLMGQGPYQIANNRIGQLTFHGTYIYDRFIGGPWTWSGNLDQSGRAIPPPRGLPFPAAQPKSAPRKFNG